MKTFLSLIPSAIEIAKIAEAAVPIEGKGKEKLAFAIQVAEASYETEEELRSAWSDKSKFLEAIAKAVSVAVTLLNAVGIFKKATAATAAA